MAVGACVRAAPYQLAVENIIDFANMDYELVFNKQKNGSNGMLDSAFSTLSLVCNEASLTILHPAFILDQLLDALVKTDIPSKYGFVLPVFVKGSSN